MFVTSLKWKLDPEAIRGTPRTQGVYGLWEEGELVYIGTTARDRLLPDALYNLASGPLRNEPQADIHPA